MNKKISVFIILAMVCFATSVYAVQKTQELTTYYPAPYGEYTDITSTNLTVSNDASVTNDLTVGGLVTTEKLRAKDSISVRYIKISDGAGANKILTSDAMGNASWHSFIIENRDVVAGDPVSPATGQMWLRTDI